MYSGYAVGYLRKVFVSQFIALPAHFHFASGLGPVNCLGFDPWRLARRFAIFRGSRS